MKRSLPHVLAVLVLVGAAAFALVLRAQEVKTGKRSDFMRQKLEFSKNVLQGLTTEDYPLIVKNAKALKTLSQAAEWEVPTIPNVEQYIPYTAEFQRKADELMKKAKDKNLDGATLAYVQMTVNCVNCHKYVRDILK